MGKKIYKKIPKADLVLSIIHGLAISLVVGCVVISLLIQYSLDFLGTSVLLFSFLASVISFIVFYFFNIYPKKVTTETSFTRFIKRHKISLKILGYAFLFATYCLGFRTMCLEDSFASFLNIEWVMFGLATTFFTVWNAFYLTQKRKHFRNTDELSGADKFVEAFQIEKEVSNNNEIYFPLVVFFINLCFLIFTTQLVYIRVFNVEVTKFFIIFSFFITSSCALIVFSEIARPIIIAKKEYDEKLKGYIKTNSEEALAQMVVEIDVLKTNADKYKDLTEEERKETISRLTEELIRTQKEEKTQVEKKIRKNVLIKIGVITFTLVLITVAGLTVPFSILDARTKDLNADYSYLKVDTEFSNKVEIDSIELVTQHISCGYATIEMMSSYYGNKVTEDDLDEKNKNGISTSSSTGFLTELKASISTKSFVKSSYLKHDALLKEIHASLTKQNPVAIEWAAKYENEWTLHFSLVTGLDLGNDVVTINNPYGYIENITVDEFINRTSFNAYENIPLFLNFGFAFGAFEKNTIFYAVE